MLKESTLARPKRGKTAGRIFNLGTSSSFIPFGLQEDVNSVGI